MGRLRGQSAVVLGAGIAGLALARDLARRGASVQILEQAEALREVGAGIQIAPNGAAVLRHLGLDGAVAQAGLRPRALRLINGESGAPVVALDLTRRVQDRDYHCLHRADLLEILRQGAQEAGAQLVLGARVAQVDMGGDTPRLHLSNGRVMAAPLLLGADGLHSVLRRALCGAEAPFFTGQVAWRAIIANDKPAEAVEVQVHMGAGRHLVSYPLRGGALRNIVAVQARRDWARESWSQRGDPAVLRAAFADFSPRVQSWLAAVQDVGEWGLFRHPIAPEWGRLRPKGAAVLLGDAAHPTLPFLAQGASMGLEDGAVLAQLLDDLPLDAAIARYQALRAPRVGRIIAAANRNARNYHYGGLLRDFGHFGLRSLARVAPGLLLRRFDWLYGYDASAPQSGLGAGQGG
jgi:salicylate hydroxylase